MIPKLIFLFICFYIIGLETLPTELQRNFNLMRDLDQRTQGRMLPIKYVITILIIMYISIIIFTVLNFKLFNNYYDLNGKMI